MYRVSSIARASFRVFFGFKSFISFFFNRYLALMCVVILDFSTEKGNGQSVVYISMCSLLEVRREEGRRNPAEGRESSSVIIEVPKLLY